MVRVGAIHLGWDVVSVAAGGSGVPIRPVRVEGSYNPPAYLLADAAGRLYTAGVEKQRPDLGMAIPDVREILGHPQIVIAGATWPAELVFRARLYNPMAAIGTYLRGKPDVIALPYPDDWPEPKIDAYAQLVEQLDVEVEPIPESIALSGYVRALGLVRPPDHRLPDGIGATAVHFDGRVVDGRANVLVVAVHGDEERPTESVYVSIDPESTRNPRIADDTVIEVMAAARAMGADNSTVLLAGQVVFNETLRFAFRNHLGQRLKKAEHPMHALVLGATHLLVSENEDDEEPESYAPPGPPAAPHPVASPPGADRAAPVPPEPAGPSGPGRPAPGGPYPPAPGAPQPPHPGPGRQMPASGAAPGNTGTAPAVPPPPAQPSPYGSSAQPPGSPGQGAGEDATVKVERGELPPPISGPASRFTRPPDPATGSQAAVPFTPHPGSGPPGSAPSGAPAPPDTEAEGEKAKGRLWNKMKDNLFGAHAVIGAAALAASVWGGDGAGTAQAAPGPTGIAVNMDSVAGCVPMPRVTVDPPEEADTAGPEGAGTDGRLFYARVPTAPGTGTPVNEQAPAAPGQDDAMCERPGIDTLRYLVPGLPGIADPGPPIDL
ncbi:hypothetical protein [Nocardia sp. X0981]